MQIQLRAFTISFSVLIAAIVLIISIWTRVSADFGDSFMEAFNSIHPHPFRASLESLTLLEHCAGALFDLFYAAIDGVIFSMLLALFYNRLAGGRDDANA